MNPLDPFELSLEGINLVEASAGTGKTYNITSLYIRALVEYKRKVSEILVVTYTEAATKELRDRLQKRIREAIQVLKEDEAPEGDEFLTELMRQVDDSAEAIDLLKEAVRSFDEASVYTIHGFCFHALQEQAFESGMIFDAELIGDDREIVLDAIDDYWRSWVSEVSDEPIKRPLLKFITDSGYTPNKLTDELMAFVGKPYLTVLPQDDPTGEIEDAVAQLSELYREMKSLWQQDREEVRSLLESKDLKNYRSNWLEGWMGRMDDWLRSDVASIQLFDKFEKFSQAEVDSSLKKASIKKGVSPPRHRFFNLAEEYGRLAGALVRYDVTFKKHLLNYLYRTLDKRKDEQQVLSFDDLLIKLNRALQHPENGLILARTLRARYPIALVDEFQDTDPIQYEIFRTIYGQPGTRRRALFMIGDPKQSIYSFRGADVFAYLQARRDADEDKVFSLNKNFRSVPGILQGIEAIFQRHPNPFVHEKISFEPVQPGKGTYRSLRIDGKESTPIQIRNLALSEESYPLNKSTATELVAADTAQQVASLMHKGNKGEAAISDQSIRARDIAVLVRTHSQADIISRALRERNIKSVQYSQQSVFESNEARELELLLRAVAEPADEGRIKSALATRLMGYNAQELSNLEEDEASWSELLKRFSDWHFAWQEHGFGFMFRAWLRDSEAFCQIIEYRDGERQLTNVRHLAELLQKEEQENQRGSRGLIRWLVQKREETDRRLEDEQIQLESDEELVKVVTMHRSKGLEYPIVFCPFLWHGPEYADYGNPLVFHDREDLTETYLDLHGKEDPDRPRKRLNTAMEDLAESIRLAYVALTRAEHRCYLSWAQAAKSELSPLGYLLLPPEQAKEVLHDTIERGSKYSPLDPIVFEEALKELIAVGRGSIELESVTEITEGDKVKNGLEPVGYERRQFGRAQKDLRPRFEINSFSSLMRRHEGPDAEQPFEQYFDEPLNEPAEIEEEQSKERTIFTFPKGPQPGTCIHKIFEEIEFTDLSGAPEVVEENLNLYGIDIEWKEVVMAMLETTVNQSLLTRQPGMKLAALQPSDLIHELEFYYRMKPVEVTKLYRIIRGGSPDLETLYNNSSEGFMKGFVDLTFCYDNRFYILDYKTNYLGDSIQDYNSEILKEEMEKASYDLQYHIYTVALHRYLSRRVRNYSYDKHFGGAFYLFLRGINKQGREGIYFHRPDKKVLQSLDQYLESGRTL